VPGGSAGAVAISFSIDGVTEPSAPASRFSAGNGSPNHIAAELFCRLAGVEMLHVPYKGGGPATAGIAGGQVGVLFTGLGNVWEHVKAGRLNLLAVTENRRSQLLPGVPMVGEVLPGYEVAVWYGVWAPAGMRPELQNRLNAEVNRILTLPDVKQRLDAMGAEHVSLSAREAHALLPLLERRRSRGVPLTLLGVPIGFGVGFLPGAAHPLLTLAPGVRLPLFAFDLALRLILHMRPPHHQEEPKLGGQHENEGPRE